MAWRVGIDVGGTFTDLYAWDAELGATRSTKVLTTPEDRTNGVLNALKVADITLSEVSHLYHGTTTATNALLERRFPDAAMITTTGFRDTIEIGRQLREKMYDPYQSKPAPYIRRRFRFTVDERVNFDGTIARRPDLNDIDSILDQIERASIKSIAICFLNSHVNGENELLVAERIRQRLPGVHVALSRDTVPVFREHPRFSTTVIRAVTMPIMAQYFDRLGQRLEAAGFSGRLMILKSNGGLARVAYAAEHPEHLVESGPAGGVAYAAHLESTLGLGKILHSDMGGTSFDVSVVENGQGLMTRAYELEFQTPVCVPMLEIHSVGAGGGSIGWIDEAGALRCGPQSAGSSPGPACYGRGGTLPTITDANVVLGRLDPNLGSKFKLDVEAARAAIRPLADRLNMTIEQAAEGMIHISTEHMADAVKMVLVERGRDPRDYALASFGGAGPMHACAVAESMNIDRIVVPAYAGVASAFGATSMNVRYDVEAFHLAPCATADITALNAAYNALEEKAASAMAEEGLTSSQFAILRSAQMRYVGQTNEISVDIPLGELSSAELEAIKQRFHEAHDREFGVSSTDFEPAFVSLAVAAVSSENGAPSVPVRKALDAAPPTTRPVYFDGQWRDTLVRVGETLNAREEISGPAIIQYDHACCVIPPEFGATIDEANNLIIRKSSRVEEAFSKEG